MRFSSFVFPAVIALAANVNAAPLHVAREPAVALNLAAPGLAARGSFGNVFDARAPTTDEDVAKALLAAAMLQGRDLEELEARGGVPGLSSILNAIKTIFRGVPRDLDARAEPTDEDIAKALIAAAMLQGRDLDARGGVPGLSSILNAIKTIFRGVPRDLNARAEPTDEDIAKALIAAAMLQGRDLDARGGVPGLSSILNAIKTIFRGVPRDLDARAEPTDEDIAKALIAAAMLQGRDLEDLEARGGVPGLSSILNAIKTIFRGVPRDIDARAEPTDEDIAKALVAAALLQGRDVEDLNARGGVPPLGSILSALKNIFLSRDLDARAPISNDDIMEALIKASLLRQARDVEELDARGGVPPLGSILTALKNIFFRRGLDARAQPTDEDIAKALVVAAMLQN